MNRRIVFLISAITMAMVGMYVLKPVMEDQWVRFIDFTNPNYSETLKTEWQNKPTDFLITKLNHPNVAYSGIAASLLRERTDKSRIEQIIRVINQRNNLRGRGLALSVLFFWDEEKAIGLSMEILKSGTVHPLFQDAIGMLAYRKYSPAFPYVLEMARQPNGYKNGSVGMLKKFGRPEAIPVLEDMLKNIKNEDPVAQGFLVGTIRDAIQNINSKPDDGAT